MSQAIGGAGPHIDAREASLTTLGSRTDLAPRVRQLLEGILSLCSSGLERVLVATLDDTESQLFKLAEQGRSNEQQHRCFETLREIKRGRADVTPRYMLAIEDALAQFDRLELPQESEAVATRPGRSPVRRELSLVDTNDLEEALALQEFATKTEIRQAQALHSLGHRFGVLAGAPMFDAENLPIGPFHLGQALLRACACLDITAEHRVVLYRAFDRVTMAAIGKVYEAANTYLIGHHILRHLPAHTLTSTAHPSHDKPSSAPTETTEPADAPHADRAATAHGSRGATPPLHAAAPSRPSAPHAAAAPANLAARGVEVANWSSPPAHAVPPDERDSELFTTLRQLLGGRRHALGVADSVIANGYVPSGEDVQSVLGTLQSKPIAPIMMGDKLVQRSVAHLKQDVLAHLRQRAPDGRAPQLAPEDSDTIDLVGLLFDYIMKSVHPDGSTQALMTKLQVPLLRVALRDKSFFTRQTHPARQLLNTIAETGTHWLDDSESPADRALVDKMQLVVDRVTQEFDGNLDVMEDMLTGLTQHMQTLARKAEVTERRHVDAARGREKLSVARKRAGDEIGARIATARPGKLVRTILEQAWTDVLALTLLRQGEGSELYKKRLAVADQLLASSTGRDGDSKPPLALREEIEAGLSQVGYHKDDIQTVVKRLFLPEQADNEKNPSSNTEIAIKLKSKARLGDDGIAHPDAKQRKTMIKPGSEQERMLERLKTLPFGTWFEFRTNQQGNKVRRKLAWFSTLTGRCLFVNQRGVRADEKTLEQLAHDVINGEATIVEAETDSLVDRAWKAIMASLKQLVGRDPAPASA